MEFHVSEFGISESTPIPSTLTYAGCDYHRALMTPSRMEFQLAWGQPVHQDTPSRLTLNWDREPESMPETRIGAFVSERLVCRNFINFQEK